jgi:hypothetical protein
MAEYIIKADAVTGLKDRSYIRGQVVDESALPESSINDLVKYGHIEKIGSEDIADYSVFSLSELREMFPEIKASSKAKFLEQL